MTTAIRSVFLITKAGDPHAVALGDEMALWLHERGIAITRAENPGTLSSCETSFPELEHGPEPDLVLVLGGDGTMLSVARRLKCRAPLLGVNLGKVGFLTELCPADWRERLGPVLERGVGPCERMALAYTVLRPGEARPLAEGRVINDLVVSRGALARLTPLHLAVDGEEVAVVRSDGLIVSTPTGATGYGVSAAGPLLHPALGVYCVTAICPFMREFHPLVLPAEAALDITVLESAAEVFLTLDGQDGLKLRSGDRIEVRRAARGFSIVRLEGSSYFAKLRAKGFVREHAQPGEPGMSGGV